MRKAGGGATDGKRRTQGLISNGQYEKSAGRGEKLGD